MRTAASHAVHALPCVRGSWCELIVHSSSRRSETNGSGGSGGTGATGVAAAPRRRRESWSTRQLRKQHTARRAASQRDMGDAARAVPRSAASEPRLVPMGQGFVSVGEFGRGGDYG